MAKKATSKPKEDKTTLPKVIPVAKVVTPEPPVVKESSEEDDDPFADTSKEVKFPARVEIEQETEASDDPFSEDGNTEEEDESDAEELTESTEKVEEEESEDIPVFDDTVVNGLKERIRILEEENTLLQAFKEERLLNDASVKEDSVSDLFDRLYKRIKDERVEMVLAMVQDGYLKLKYKSHTEAEKEKLELKLKKFLAQQMEGTVRAAKIIHESELEKESN